MAATMEWVASLPERHRLDVHLVADLARQASDLVAGLLDESGDPRWFPPVIIPLALAGDFVVPVAAACSSFHLATRAPGTPAAQVWLSGAAEFLCELPPDLAVPAIRALVQAAARLADGRPAGAEALGCYARVAAIGAGFPESEAQALWQWGLAAGAGREREARTLLAASWLPWGARPILEGLSGSQSGSAAGERISGSLDEGTKIL
ncbi:MAG: hypothetical protein FJZ01_01090 [Candidatus Sericytochromatia bacterium]|nr:hypothetical protein [Candidatus Tanganyikabacteria bacterium]